MKQPIVLGADIGGSHITTALVNRDTSTIVAGSLHRGPVDANGPATGIIRQWSEVMLKSIRHAEAVQQLGIAMPGPFDYEKGISLIRGFHKYESLYGLNVKTSLASQLGISPAQITMANDARCFLQGELVNGAAKGAPSVLGFTLGTGFGSAIAENGIARDAAYFDTPFLASRAEDYFSTRWFVKRYHELQGNKSAANVKEIAAAANECPVAAQVFREFGAHLALFLSTIPPLPPVIVLGGNIAHTFPLFYPALQQGMKEHRLSTSFVVAALGEHAALTGAASLCR
jgi:glucokinase